MADDQTSSAVQGLNTTLQAGNQSFNAAFEALIAALGSIFPQVSTITGGTFTLTAATSITVTQVLTAANSFIFIAPTNASAGTLMAGANSLYLSARTANTSFAYSTAGGGAAAGTETFIYILITL